LDSNITIKEFGDSYSGVDLKNRTISGKISTIYQDRDQEVVPPSALETDIEVYKQNPILILSHNHKSLPIGKALDIKFNSDHVWAKYYITKNPIGDEVLQLAHEGILNGFSSGFVPLEFKENPQAHEVPSIALKTSLGRKTKKLYKRCELVEVSMLAIPSNRQSLIDRTEKGNKAAGLVFKAFYGDKNEDLSLVLKELMIEENPPPVYTLKSLWQENEHPRANDGQFTSKPGEVKPIEVMPSDSKVDTMVRDVKEDVRHEDITKKLDESIQEQRASRAALNDIKSNTDWSDWFTKWGIRAAMAVGGYFLAKRFFKNTSAYVKDKVRNFLGGGVSKGLSPKDDIDQMLSLLADIRDALTRGRELGLEDTSDYKRLLKAYNASEDKLKEIVGYGLKSLLSGIVVKEMSKEEFDETEHPRDNDGKFTDKSKSGAAKKPKAKKSKSVKNAEGTLNQVWNKTKEWTSKDASTATYKDWAIASTIVIGSTIALMAAQNPKLFADMVRQFARDIRAKVKGLGGATYGQKLHKEYKEAFDHTQFYVREKFYQEQKLADRLLFEENLKKGIFTMPRFNIDIQHTMLKSKLGVPDVKSVEEAQEKMLKWHSLVSERQKKYEIWEDKYMGRKPRHEEAVGSAVISKKDKIKATVEDLKKAKAEGKPYNEGELRVFEAKLKEMEEEAKPNWFVRIINAIFGEVKKKQPDIVKAEEYKGVMRLLAGDAKEAEKQSRKENLEKTKKILESLGKENKGFEEIVIKEMSPENFKEEEHPRHADGKFRNKSEGAGVKKAKATTPQETIVDKVSILTRSEGAIAPKDHIDKAKEWISENKVKSGLIAGVGLVSAPMVFMALNFKGRLASILYSDIGKRTVAWDKLSDAEKIAWRNQAQPGDIFLSGGKPQEGFAQFAKDIYSHVVRGDHNAMNRYKETLGKAINGSSYVHSQMIVGHYDIKFHQKTLDALMHPPVKNKISHMSRAKMLLNDVLLSDKTFKGVGAGKAEILEAQKLLKSKVLRANYAQHKAIVDKYSRAATILNNPSLAKNTQDKMNAFAIMKKNGEVYKRSVAFIRKVERATEISKKYEEFYYGGGSAKELIGKFIIASGSSSKKESGQIRLYVNDHPMLGKDAIGAILRTKVPEETRRSMSKKIIDAAFNGEDVGISYSAGLGGDIDARGMAPYGLSKIGDPLTKRMTTAYLRDNKVLCSGAIAQFYEKFAGVKVADDVKFIFPGDLLKDKKFASTVIEAGGEKPKWKPAEEVVDKVRTGAKLGIGTVAAAGAAVGLVKDKYKNTKGLSDLLLVTKAMTKEEFDESEHPRNPKGSEHGGEFVAKPGTGGGKLSPVKGSHGGAREAAGRLPKEAHNAVPKLKERFRKQNPDASEDQITQMVVDYAKDPSRPMKPDYLEFIENPDNYFKKLEEDRRNAMLTKVRKSKFGDGTVREGETSGETGEIVDETRGSVSKWNRAVKQSKSIMQAKAIFDKEDASQSEKNAARLIYGTAFVAAAIGLATMMRGSKGFVGAGFEVFDPIKNKLGKKYGSLYRPVENTGATNPMNTVRDSLYRVMKIKPNPPADKTAKVANIDEWNEIYARDVGFWNRLMGRIARVGEEETVVLGPSIVGRGPTSRFRLPVWRVTNNHSGNFTLQPLDTDIKSGLRLLDAKGRPEVINIAIATGVIKKPSGRVKEMPKGLILSKDKKEWIIEDKELFMNSLTEGKRPLFQEIKSPSKGKEAATPEGEIKVDQNIGIYTIGPNKHYELIKANLPELLAQRWEGSAQDAWKLGAEAHRGLANFLDGQVWPSISRKTLAYLSVATTGVGGGTFYFQQDIESMLRERGRQDESAYDVAEKIRKKKEQLNKKAGVNKTDIKALTNLSKAQEAAAKAKTHLEVLRKSAVDELVKHGFRSAKEGARTNFGLTMQTIQREAPNAAERLVDRALTKDLLQKYSYSGKKGMTEFYADLLQNKKKALSFMEDVAENIKKDSEFRQYETGKQSKPDFQEQMRQDNKSSKTRQEAEEEWKKYTGKKEFYDLVLKALNGVEESLLDEEKPATLDEITTAIAEELATMISDMSETCRLMIENGVPGHSKYEEINDILVEIYAYMKDRAKTEKPENTEISTKSFDKSFETPYMSTQSDSGGGMFTGRKKPNAQEKCPKCQSMATEETVSKCDKADCPYSFIDMIEEKN
jgi:hypothetical protein